MKSTNDLKSRRAFDFFANLLWILYFVAIYPVIADIPTGGNGVLAFQYGMHHADCRVINIAENLNNLLVSATITEVG